MGHRFCRSHWRTKSLTDITFPDDWRETPCFATVRNIYMDVEAIQTKIIPTFINSAYGLDEKYPCRQTPEMALEFIEDVQLALPGVVEVLELPKEGPYVFQYRLSRHENYWKFLGVASLMRYVEEFWMWVEEYHDLKKAGIPRDVALFCCNLSGRAASEFVGHAFSPSLHKLMHWKDFSLKRNLLDNPANTLSTYGTGLWQLVCSSNNFGGNANWPPHFKMTKERYDVFADPASTMADKKRILGLVQDKKVYGEVQF